MSGDWILDDKHWGQLSNITGTKRVVSWTIGKDNVVPDYLLISIGGFPDMKWLLLKPVFNLNGMTDRVMSVGFKNGASFEEIFKFFGNSIFGKFLEEHSDDCHNMLQQFIACPSVFGLVPHTQASADVQTPSRGTCCEIITVSIVLDFSPYTQCHNG